MKITIERASGKTEVYEDIDDFMFYANKKGEFIQCGDSKITFRCFVAKLASLEAENYMLRYIEEEDV